MTRTRRFLFGLAPIAWLATGCGSDSDTDVAAPSSSETAPSGYEPLCEMGLAMWPLTSAFAEVDDLDASMVAALYGDLSALLHEYLPRLPVGQVADDTRTLADGVAVVAEVVGEYAGPFEESMEQAESDERLSFLFDEANDFNAAGERWDEALEVNCGLRL